MRQDGYKDQRTIHSQLRDSCLDVRTDQLQVPFGKSHSLFRFRAADQSDVIKSVVAFSTHVIEQCEDAGGAWIEMLLRKFNNGNVVSELNARTLAVAQHQRERGFQHGLIGGLVGRFFIDAQVLARRLGFLSRVGEKLHDLLRIGFLRLGLAHVQSDRFVCRSRYLE